MSSPSQAPSFQEALQQAVKAGVQPGVPLASGNGQFVNFDGFPMTAETAEAFGKLETLVRQRFPGKSVVITSTVEGKHQDPNHYAGKAVDFVVPGITNEESKTLEQLCRQAGFSPFNEYLNDSLYKTGPHMHVDLAHS